MKRMYEYVDELLKNETEPNDVFTALAEDPDCYSEKLVSPLEINWQRQNLVAYVKGSEVLIVLIDQMYEKFDELADEEFFNGETPIWFAESSHRKSPMYLLKTTADIMSKYNDVNITIMLVTSSYIINFDDWAISDFGHKAIVKHFKKMDINIPVSHSNNLIFESYIIENYNLHAALSFVKNMQHGPQPVIIDYEDEEEEEDYDDDEMINIEDNVDIEDIEESEDIDDEDLEQFFNFKESVLENDDDFNAIEDKPSPYSVLAQAQREDSAPVRILAPMENPQDEFDKLVGMKDIRTLIENLVSLQIYNKRLYEYTKKWHSCSLHSVFSGAVGTGKTTVAQIMGSLLKEAGVLSKGHCVICNRASFIGRNWGTEESRVMDVLEKAHGGVLLIDEAYSLVSKHPHDPGQNVLPLMLEVLSDEKYRDIAVILCGYGKQMDELLNTNPGLDSRFPNRFKFSEFSFDELMEITRRHLAEFNYKLTPKAKSKYKTTLRQLYDARGETWGNGREIVNRLDQIYKAHSVRCVQQNLYGEDLLTIKCCDIPEISTGRNRRSMGFIA